MAVRREQRRVAVGETRDGEDDVGVRIGATPEDCGGAVAGG